MSCCLWLVCKYRGYIGLLESRAHAKRPPSYPLMITPGEGGHAPLFPQHASSGPHRLPSLGCPPCSVPHSGSPLGFVLPRGFLLAAAPIKLFLLRLSGLLGCVAGWPAVPLFQSSAAASRSPLMAVVCKGREPACCQTLLW